MLFFPISNIGGVDINKITSDASTHNKNLKEEKLDRYASSSQKWMSMAIVNKKTNTCMSFEIKKSKLLERLSKKYN